MLTKKKVERFFQNYFIYFLLLGFARRIWDIPILDTLFVIFGTFFLILIFLMIYLSWRETHSFWQVFKQNWGYIIAIIVPIMILLLYALFRS